MKDSLAKELLAKVTNWDAERLTKERLDLDLLSEFKYDEYQPFSPGMRFLESLALWLNQFQENHKELAYNFVKNKLIFISNAELNHLIKMSYPDLIKQYLINHVSVEFNIDEIFINKIINNKEFEKLKRQCLFLGLSDGARTDIFRRYSQLQHEQVYPIYQITKEKIKEFLKELNEDIQKITNKSSNEKYKIVFLLDDFSASGISYLRRENSDFAGKIQKFYEQIKPTEEKKCEKNFMRDLFDIDNLKICVVLYLATKSAIKRIKQVGNEMIAGSGITFDVMAVQELDDSLSFTDENLGDLLGILKGKFDGAILTPQYKKGKHDKPYLGFNECGLVLVLSHNCPNNSLPIIWHESKSKGIRALFPRLQRYKVPSS